MPWPFNMQTIVGLKDDMLHKKAKRLRWFGYDREEKQRLGGTDPVEGGYKYHMNDISAAIGLGNLKAFDKLLGRYRRTIEAYKEGGITAHVSVISRELGIPCIVGAINATSIFKDGELVEVDAEKGVARKIS